MNSDQVEAVAKELTYLPVLKRVCCCSLEAGCFMLGTLNLITSSAIIVVQGDNIARRWWAATDAQQGPPASCGDVRVGLVAVPVAFCVVTLVTVVLLFPGVAKRRPSLLRPFVVMAHINVTVSAHYAVLGPMSNEPATTIALELLSIALVCACLLCVNSLRVRLLAHEQVNGGATLLPDWDTQADTQGTSQVDFQRDTQGSATPD